MYQWVVLCLRIGEIIGKISVQWTEIWCVLCGFVRIRQRQWLGMTLEMFGVQEIPIGSVWKKNSGMKLILCG